MKSFKYSDTYAFLKGILDARELYELEQMLKS